MGSTQSSLFGPEAMAAGAIVAGAAVTAVAIDNGWFGRSAKKTGEGGEPSESTGTKTKKKGGKKSKEDKELDKILAEAVKERKLAGAAILSASASRVVGVPDVVPGSFDDTPLVEESETKKKKKRKAAAKKGESAASSVLVTSPENSILRVPPAALEAVVAKDSAPANAETAVPSKKSKKRKAASVAPAQSQVNSQQPSSSVPVPSNASKTKPKVDTKSLGDDSDAWTHVAIKKRAPAKRNPSKTPLEAAVGDTDSVLSPTGTSASASLSLTGDEPTTETSAADAETTDKASADEEEETGVATGIQSKSASLTGVEDMLPPPNPPVRVLRVAPGPNDRPAPGFSWGDYEEAETSAHDGEDEDDEGWGVVRSRRSVRSTTAGVGDQGSKPSTSSTSSSKAPETMTKRKRQNKVRHEQEKAEKDAAEKERQRVLREHQRGLENLRMEQQSKQGKQLSGGSKASLDSSGRLVWD